MLSATPVRLYDNRESFTSRAEIVRVQFTTALVVGPSVPVVRNTGNAARAPRNVYRPIDQRAEIQTHTESLKQLGDSFQSEVQPMVVEVEGRTLQLKGSAEQQYAEWRQLLKELYENETGLPAVAGSSASNGAPAGATKP